jgi:hypothetical protein
MKPACIVLLVFGLLFLGCGGGARLESKSAGDETEVHGMEEGEFGDPDAPPAVPCETSDDCAEGQFCVDDECAIPAPAGFY